MGDEIRFVKNIPDAIEKIKILRMAGFDIFPDVERIIWEFENNPEHPTWKLERFLFKNDQILNDALLLLAKVQQAKEANPFYPPPSGAELEAISGSIPLGIVNHDQAICGLDPIDLTRGLHICGNIGSGKTYSATRMYHHILSIPKSIRGYNIIGTQVVKREADYLSKKHPSLRILEYKDIRYNSWQIEPWDDPETKIKSAISIFASTNYLMTLTQPILKQAVRLCYEKGIPPTFTDINLQLSQAFSILEQQGYTAKDSVDKIRLRLSEFEDTKEIFNCRYGYPIEGFWSKEDIILNLMDEPNPYIYSTFITDLLISLMRFYFRHPVPEPRLRTLIAMDECRSVIPNRKDPNDFDSDRYLEQFITTARSSGIGRITITQEPESVSEYLLKNSAFFLTFPVFGPSLQTIQKYQNLSDEQAAFMFSLPEHGVGVMRDVRFPRPYIVDIPYDLEEGQITKEETEAIMRPYITALQDSIRPKEPAPVQIEKRKSYTQDDIDRIRRELDRETFAILQYLQKHPFKNKTEIGNATHVGQKKTELSIEALKNRGLIQEVEAFTSVTQRKTLLYPVTEKGFEVLGTPESSRRPMPERFRHTYYLRRVKESLEARDIRAYVEYRPESFQGLGRVDVYASIENRRIAFEITLSFSNLLKNIQKCKEMGMHEVRIICEDQAGAGKAGEAIDRSLDKETRKIVRVEQIRDYMRKSKGRA